MKRNTHQAKPSHRPLHFFFPCYQSEVEILDWIKVAKSEEVGTGRLQTAQVGQVWCCWPDSARPDPTWLCGVVLGDDRQWSPKMLSLDGLEMIAVLVVMGLFIKVLEQFGMFEPVGGEGNRFSLRFVGIIMGQLWYRKKRVHGF